MCSSDLYELKDRQMDAGRVMYKKPTIPEEVRAYEPPVDIHELMSDITLSRLHEIFESIMKKQQDKIDPLRSKFGKIEKEEVSLEDKMEDLKKYAAGHRHFSFRGLLTAQSSKVEVIVTFLAILVPLLPLLLYSKTWLSISSPHSEEMAGQSRQWAAVEAEPLGLHGGGMRLLRAAVPGKGLEL